MNALHPLAVYAAVQAHKGEKLEYPGYLAAWLGVCEHSTAMLTGYQSEWAVLEDKCKDQKVRSKSKLLLLVNDQQCNLVQRLGLLSSPKQPPVG